MDTEQKEPEPLDPARAWTREDVARFLQISLRQVDREASRPGFPKAKRIAGRRRWLGANIIAWFGKQTA